MDQYHVWADLKDSHRDLQFADAVAAYLGRLKEMGLVESFRLSRRKLGLGPSELGEFHIVIETRDLGQLEEAYQEMVKRAGETDSLHRAVYGMVTNVRFGLWRDFPDPARVQAAKP